MIDQSVGENPAACITPVKKNSVTRHPKTLKRRVSVGRGYQQLDPKVPCVGWEGGLMMPPSDLQMLLFYDTSKKDKFEMEILCMYQVVFTSSSMSFMMDKKVEVAQASNRRSLQKA